MCDSLSSRLRKTIKLFPGRNHGWKTRIPHQVMLLLNWSRSSKSEASCTCFYQTWHFLNKMFFSMRVSVQSDHTSSLFLWPTEVPATPQRAGRERRPRKILFLRSSLRQPRSPVKTRSYTNKVLGRSSRPVRKLERAKTPASISGAVESTQSTHTWKRWLSGYKHIFSEH